MSTALGFGGARIGEESCIRDDDDTGRVARPAPAGEGHEPGRGTRCSGAAGGVQRPRGRREASRRVPAGTRSVRHPRAQQYGGRPHQQQLLRVGDPADERRVLRRNPRRDADKAAARPDPHVDEGGAVRRDRPGVGRRGVHGARAGRGHSQSEGRSPRGRERTEPARATMTSQPKAEDLTLPEPARTLLSRTRGILDTYVTPRTPDRSGCIIGGGTILSARWRHRESRDIDLLVHPRTETRFLQPAAAPELHRRLEATGASKISFGRFSQIVFAESKIEMLAAEPQPRIGHRRARVDGREATTRT
ncbi:MAG: hypothetical protein F4X11_10115 [Acidobacteria bacterium]|nr:hypothetical protein [Acidobacteriota bacterium]